MEIWDKGLDLLNKASYSLNTFTENDPKWIELEFPNVEANDKFYVHVYPKLEYQFPWVIFIEADDSIPNEHSNFSDLTSSGDIKKISSWPYSAVDKSKVNWMIRVVGTYLEQR